MAEFYGFDQELPCVSNAMFLVKYDLFVVYDEETGNTDFWVNCTEVVCDAHRGEIVTYAEKNPADLQITSVQHIPGTSVNDGKPDILVEEVRNANNGMDWEEWYRNLPIQDNYRNL